MSPLTNPAKIRLPKAWPACGRRQPGCSPSLHGSIVQELERITSCRGGSSLPKTSTHTFLHLENLPHKTCWTTTAVLGLEDLPHPAPIFSIRT